jgi:hypothetical protein
LEEANVHQGLYCHKKKKKKKEEEEEVLVWNMVCSVNKRRKRHEAGDYSIMRSSIICTCH